MVKSNKSRVGPKGQIIIPARLRRKHGIKSGTQVSVYERGTEIIFQPLTDEYIRSMAGIARTWGKGDLLKALMDMKKTEREL
ncbi:MAG: hypothetical protein A3F68_00450 [Acidobacteria bacterium RIFCSPLOWO2_12_FULL_54_10]|nr:MAG: hypothetical protein A3F68_00450 [Acidobacteria bacterium RIFCSPLOWO2_12_FULL_54_10]